MSQATIERPAATKTAGKSRNPREKILCTMKDLIGQICAMVEAEQGDCAGRVLEHASTLVIDATNQFLDSDADTSYHTMLEADSFVQAAAALTEREYQEKNKLRERWTAAQRMADLSAAILTDQDQRLTDISSGKVQAVAAADEPAGPVVGADDPEVTLTSEAAHLVTNCTYQIETCILLMQDAARRTDDETTGVHLPIVVQALGVRIEQLNQCITDTVFLNTTGPSLEDVRGKVEGQSLRLMNLTPRQT